MERRSFFTRMFTGVGAASAIAQASSPVIPEQTGTPGLPIYMVDETRVDREALYNADLPAGTYVFYYPSPNDHFPPIMKVAEHDQAERLEISLAGVSTAAHGGTSPEAVAKPTDWAWHPAYQDTLDLRRKYDAAVRVISDMTPVNTMIALYPCGCSAMGNRMFGANAELPIYCAEHGDHEHLNGHLIHGKREV